MNFEINQIVRMAGGQAALARSLLTFDNKVTQSHVWNWIHRDKKIPADKIIPICAILSWAKTPHELSPEIYPNPNDGLPPAITKKRHKAA